MKFVELMKALGEKLGGIELSPDESGAVTLEVDKARVMILDLQELDSVAFYMPVATPPPEENLGRLYRSVLEANHELADTSGATLSLNHETGEIYLCRAMPTVTLDGESLVCALESFVGVHEKWCRIVADFRGGEESSEASADAEPSFGGFMQV